MFAALGDRDFGENGRLFWRNRGNLLSRVSVCIRYQDFPHTVPVRETGQCERRASILDDDVSPVRKADWSTALSGGLQFHAVSTDGNFQSQDLDLIGKQAPATRVSGFDGFPGDAGNVE